MAERRTILGFRHIPGDGLMLLCLLALLALVVGLGLML